MKASELSKFSNSCSVESPKTSNELTGEEEKVIQQQPTLSKKSPSKPVDTMGWLCPSVMTVRGFLCRASVIEIIHTHILETIKMYFIILCKYTVSSVSFRFRYIHICSSTDTAATAVYYLCNIGFMLFFVKVLIV